MKNKPQFKNIGKNIRELRRHRGMTQKELADAAGLRVATISDIETGKARFQFNTLVRIADAMGCRIDIFLSPN